MSLEEARSASLGCNTLRAEVHVDVSNTAAKSRTERYVDSEGYSAKPAVLPSGEVRVPETSEFAAPLSPLQPSSAKLLSTPSSASVSTCCTSQLQRLHKTLESVASSPTRPGVRARTFSPRQRRVSCGCGGRGCLCAYAPEPGMMTEETGLLYKRDSEDLVSRRAVASSQMSFILSGFRARCRRWFRSSAAARAASRTTGLTAAAAEAKTNLLIEGMTCTSCAAHIEARLHQLDGVLGASVNFSTLSGQVLHNPAVASLEKVVGCVADMGYTVTVRNTTFALDTIDGEKPRQGECTCSTSLRGVPVYMGNAISGYEHRVIIEGMSCASCAARIEQALRKMPAVLSCVVSFATGTAVITTLTPSDHTDACRRVESLGYVVTDPALLQADASVSRTREALERTREIAEHGRSLIGSAILCLPLVVVMVLMMFMDMRERPRQALIIDGVQLCAVTPIVLHFGKGFFISAWRSWRHDAYTMDTLVAIGTGCTYAYSTVVYLSSLFVHPHAHTTTYFDTAGVLTTFMLLGRFLEARAKRSTSGALIELMNLIPSTAVCVQPGGSEVRVSTSQLQKGDLVRVLAGDRVPVDGTILEGSSELDEQMVTGESMWKQKRPGEGVVGGTLNITASLLIRADNVGEETMVAQVLRIVQEAQNTKPAIQRAADRIAMFFVPFVIGFSLLTLGVWLVLGVTGAYPLSWRGAETSWQSFAFNFFISTVVSACPCALGLATPTAIMVGTGVGAKNGVLVKSSTTLEAVRCVNCVVLDKTGTITKGRLEVIRTLTTTEASMLPSATAVQPHVRLDAALVSRLVGLVEAQSNHPIAKAVSAKLLEEADSGADELQRRACYGVSSVVTHGGKGLEASVTVTPASDGDHEASSEQPSPRVYHLLVGNLALLRGHSVPLNPELARLVEEENRRGLTTVLAAINGTACVLVSLADEPRREARGVIQHLQEAGIHVLMVTGDSAGVAVRIAAEVGIDPQNVRAEALPTTKVSVVKRLQEEGWRVMFVGDGINDSPALAQADVGVSLGAGTEIAIEAADAVLVRNNLVDLLSLQLLSKITVRRIYANFIWAFGYNLLMLPIASGLLFPFFHVQLPPIAAGAAMMLSSLSVLVSSLSIRCFRAYRECDFYSA
ncbi:hypothetical protein JKF63_02239 [Porcisia hertigi]|uniref:HMA domain-containing protein n=1 Tax=Porcisia hertigi TaxID=2761500 RepID=A0A836L1W0_9TRYP|nr:hypothetical protein JKF63_02239 [Porcisia hertigi]